MAYPSGLPKKYRKFWNKPWLRRAAWSKGFRRWLDNNGYLTPHFRKTEAACKDGTQVPDSLNRVCRGQAFKLERLRHATGDRPIPILSWYRHRAYNARIGGASQSKHILAIACDTPSSWVRANGGQARLKSIAWRCGFKGVGTYPAGSMHFDSRPGGFVTWSSF